MAQQNSLGAKVKAIRELRSLTVAELADRAGLKGQVVDQIESGALVPSLAPLVKIARVLGVRLGTFLDDQEDVGPVFTKAGAHPKVMRFSDKSAPAHSDLELFSLAANKAGRHMEPFLVDVLPSSATEAHLSTHEGEEFLHVFSGEVEVSYGQEVYRLCPGDSIYYDSIVPHNVHCRGSAPARMLAVVYAPS